MYSNHKAPRTVSRRVVLGTAAGAGAVGAAGALGIAGLTRKDSAASGAGQGASAENAETSAVSMGTGTDSPVVVYVDPSTRAMMLFVDAEEKSVKDDVLVDRVLKAAGKA